ncbi:hypothetical protein FRB94_004586 [Tulasnella sp. JGI-2019a]|nr:hypothetical protein FRB94_004586 [Tulasnella sp. JGI-2019a]
MQNSTFETRSSFASTSAAPPYSPEVLPPYTNKDAQALFTPLAAVPPASIRPLPFPLAIPHTSLGTNSPFARAYSHELATSGISVEDWLKFTDGLNIAFMSSPPLRVVDTAGKITGMVPYHWTIIAGATITTAAQAGTRIFSKTLSDRYLRHANETYFAPRGLRVRLCRPAAMRQLVGIDATLAKPPSKTMETVKVIGRAAETVALHIPVVRIIVGQLHPAPKVDPRAEGDFTTRRMLPLQGYVLPLDFDVPPMQTPSGLVGQMDTLGVKLGKWQTERQQLDANRTRELLELRRGGEDVTGLTSSFSLKGIQARRAKRMAAWDKLIGRAPKESMRLRMMIAVEDRKEENAASGILWIVVINEEQDKHIQNVELADSQAEVEEISAPEWEQELELEDEEDARDLRERN